MVALWLSGTSFRTITITMPLRQMSARQTSCHSELVWVADEDVTRDQNVAGSQYLSGTILHLATLRL